MIYPTALLTKVSDTEWLCRSNKNSAPPGVVFHHIVNPCRASSLTLRHVQEQGHRRSRPRRPTRWLDSPTTTRKPRRSLHSLSMSVSLGNGSYPGSCRPRKAEPGRATDPPPSEDEPIRSSMCSRKSKLQSTSTHDTGERCRATTHSRARRDSNP